MHRIYVEVFQFAIQHKISLLGIKKYRKKISMHTVVSIYVSNQISLTIRQRKQYEILSTSFSSWKASFITNKRCKPRACCLVDTLFPSSCLFLSTDGVATSVICSFCLFSGTCDVRPKKQDYIILFFITTLQFFVGDVKRTCFVLSRMKSSSSCVTWAQALFRPIKKT
jgi:hypothetical protein